MTLFNVNFQRSPRMGSKPLTRLRNALKSIKKRLNPHITLIGIPKLTNWYTDYGNYNHFRNLFQDFARFSLTSFYGYAILPAE